MTLEHLIDQVEVEHRSYGVEIPSIIQRVVKQIPVPLDLLMFYDRCGRGASLFDGKYRIIGIDDLKLVPNARREWYSFCDVGDGDLVAYDPATATDGSYRILDCFHETVHEDGETAVIALSFTEFLRLALDSGGDLYWLDEKFKAYGRV